MLTKRIIGSLSYANIVATLALFLALGGASYAVVAIPDHSVGPRQLRARAVSSPALSFPLGSTYVIDRARQDIAKGQCNALPPPGRPAAPCVRAAIRRRITTPGREAHFKLSSPGRVLVSATVGLEDQGPESTTARDFLAAILDGRPIEEAKVRLYGGSSQRAPLQVPIELGPGIHRVGLTADASYDYTYTTPGDVIVSPVTVTVTVLPRLPR